MSETQYIFILLLVQVNLPYSNLGKRMTWGVSGEPSLVKQSRGS